jgi:hypothetical protein
MFDQLHGVDFKKVPWTGSCAMDTRHGAKQCSVEGDRPLPAIGARMAATLRRELDLGRWQTPACVLAADRVEQAYEAGEKLRAGEAALSLRKPRWLSLALPSPRVTA